MGLILDTNFIIVAEREAKHGITTTIDRFFASRAKESFYITFTVAGELACGQSASPKETGSDCAAPIRSFPAPAMSPGSMARTIGRWQPKDNSSEPTKCGSPPPRWCMAWES